jgi:hypothetical protein
MKVMKKQIVALLSLAVLSAPAFATKARMLGLGEDIDRNIGSLYFSDSRNIFQNAAYVNEYKDMIIMEWGDDAVGATAGGSIKKDTDLNPQAEGGFLRSAGDYVYGIYLGAESPYTNELRGYTRSIQNQNFHQDNQIDVFFGGEAGLKWGANLTYSNSENEASKAKQKSLSARLGVIKDQIDAFLNISLMNEAEINSVGATGTDEFKGQRGFEAGLTYDLDMLKVFGYVRNATWKHEADSIITPTPVTAYQGKFDGLYWLYSAGAGRVNRLNDKATLFTKLEYVNFARTVEATSGAADGADIKLDDWYVPVTIALEYDATSWLTLRGSVNQVLVGEVDNDFDGQAANVSAGVRSVRPAGKRSYANSTNVNAGMTLKFGNLNIDGVIGTEGTQSTTGEDGALSLDTLASRVAMTYKF